jgi:hypothetical protein
MNLIGTRVSGLAVFMAGESLDAIEDVAGK